MIPQQFEYSAPKTLDEALGLLAEGAKPLAGGMSLIPMMKLRLAAPEHLVDLGRIKDLNYIREQGGALHIGATTTHHEVESSALVRGKCPLLAETVSNIGDMHVRNMGTIGGSVAHADPAAEMPGIVVACDAEIAVTGKAGARVIAANEFFVSALTTALKPDEIITEILFPAWPAGRRFGFEEFALRRGDFAIAAAAVFYDLDAGGRAVNAHVGVIGVGDRPARLPSVEAALNGARVDAGVIAKAATATSAAVTPQDDIHASAAYRRSLVGTMVERALVAAAG